MRLLRLTSSWQLFLLVGLGAGLLLPAALLEALPARSSPLVALASGWIGFSLGVRFSPRALYGTSARELAQDLSGPLLAAALVAGPALVFLWGSGAPLGDGAALSLVLGAVAATGTISTTRGPLRAVLADVTALALALAGFTVLRHGTEAVRLWEWALATLSTALVGAVATWLFLGARVRADERLLLGIGMVAFTSGAAAFLLQSPVVVGAIAGAVLASLPGARHEALLGVLDKLDRPAGATLIAYVGLSAAARPSLAGAMLLACVVLGRAAALWLSTPRAGRVDSEPRGDAPLRRLTLGPLAFVIVASLTQVRADDLGRAAAWAVAVGALVSLAGSLLAARERGPADRAAGPVEGP